MEQLPNYGDQRQLARCVYCGSNTESRDHVPSKVFLDEPYPPNLPVVPACQQCNNAFALDEEYLACLIECTLVGSARIADIRREKVKRILKRQAALLVMLDRARQDVRGAIFFGIETDRVRNVVLKLARGHAAFELNEPQYDTPSSVTITPLPSLSDEDRTRFETPPRLSVWPEVGSRAMQRVIVGDPGAAHWLIVQSGRYGYMATVGEGVIVRVVLSEYLMCEVAWM